MVTAQMTESEVEDDALGWFEEFGYGVLHGPHTGPEETTAERGSRGRVGFAGRCDALLPKLQSGELRIYVAELRVVE